MFSIQSNGAIGVQDGAHGTRGFTANVYIPERIPALTNPTSNRSLSPWKIALYELRKLLHQIFLSYQSQMQSAFGNANTTIAIKDSAPKVPIILQLLYRATFGLTGHYAEFSEAVRQGLRRYMDSAELSVPINRLRGLHESGELFNMTPIFLSQLKIYSRCTLFTYKNATVRHKKSRPIGAFFGNYLESRFVYRMHRRWSRATGLYAKGAETIIDGALRYAKVFLESLNRSSGLITTYNVSTLVLIKFRNALALRPHGASMTSQNVSNRVLVNSMLARDFSRAKALPIQLNYVSLFNRIQNMLHFDLFIPLHNTKQGEIKL